MASIRIHGPSEQMGEIHPLAAAEIPDEFGAGKHAIRDLLTAVPVGSVALLDSEFNLPVVPASERQHRATFVESSDLALGRDEARHQPRFGQMVLNGHGLHERPILIGAKPFVGEDDQYADSYLTREWAASNYLNSLGDQQLAYLPLGVWKTAKGVNHLLSLYDHEVKSYDNVFWADKSLTPEALRPAVIEHALMDCVRGLGYLHGAGLIHRDAEAKNLAADMSGIRFIDLEGIKPLPRKGKSIDNSTETTNLIRHDLETFFDSTVQVDENRPDVAVVLAKSSMPGKLAKTYRAGLNQGKKEAGLRVGSLTTSSDEYFKTTVDHTLSIAQKVA